MKAVNVKYLELLNRAYDKYKDIDVIEKVPEPIENTTTGKLSQKSDKRCKVNKTKSKDKVGRKTKKLHDRKLFSPQEDQIIIDNLCHEDLTKSINILTKKLPRTYAGIQKRIEKLQSGNLRREHKQFTLDEDLMIIDSAVADLKNKGSLVNTQLHKKEDLSKTLGRHPESVFDRWESILKVWILQFHHKTLNLEIRPMLVNFLVDNFDSIEEIDWAKVLEVPEFAGHTIRSIKKLFHSNVMHRTARILDIKKSKLTIDQLAEVSRGFPVLGSVLNRNLIRQRKIIDYFQSCVEEQGIDVTIH